MGVVPFPERPDRTEIEANRAAATSKATERAYANAWRLFEEYCKRAGLVAMPASEATVEAWLAEAGKTRKPATLRLYTAAISVMHQREHQPSPTVGGKVRVQLKGHARRKGGKQAQVAALTEAVADKMCEAAPRARTTRGGALETPAQAARRSVLDVALILTMRDSMLRRSEAAALEWKDILFKRSGHALLHIVSSKTDQEAKGTVGYLSPRAAEALRLLRDLRRDKKSVFGLSPSQIARRIQAAARAAGLEGPVRRPLAARRHGAGPRAPGRRNAGAQGRRALEDGRHAGRLPSRDCCREGRGRPVLRGGLLMARSINQVTLVGYAGRDPEIRTMQNGGKVAQISLATSDQWKDRQTGEQRKHTEWHRIVIFNEALTDLVDRYVRKGSRLFIQGTLRTRKWEDRNGVERWTTEVQLARYGSELLLMDKAGEDEAYGRSGQPAGPPASTGDVDEDIPF